MNGLLHHFKLAISARDSSGKPEEYWISVLTGLETDNTVACERAAHNFTPFYKAFNVQPGDKMYKPENERMVVW